MELIARAVLQAPAGILLARLRGTDWWFLPGGHVEPDETVTAALVRELDEELGLAVPAPAMIGTVENSYVQDGRRRHEINLVFAARIPDDEFTSRVPHLEFAVHDLKTVEIRPAPLADAVRAWLDDARPFAVAIR